MSLKRALLQFGAHSRYRQLNPLVRSLVNSTPRSSSSTTITSYTRSFSSYEPSQGKKASSRGSSSHGQSTDTTEQKESFDSSRLEKEMASGVSRLRLEVKTLVNRVGRLTPGYLDGLKVDIEPGIRSPIDGVAQVIVLDPTTLSVIPYDASHLKVIEQALYDSSLNLTPNTQPDGSILLPVPRLTLETRQSLAKQASQVCEGARAVIRNARQAAQKASRKDLDSNLITKDDFKSNNKVLDDITKSHTKLIDEIENKSKRVLLDQ